MNRTLTSTIAVVSGLFSWAVLAGDSDVPTTSDFIENLPALEVDAEDSNLYMWRAQKPTTVKYQRVMIGHPELFLAEDNKYKGFQPDQMKQIADRVADAFATKFGAKAELVGQRGPGVLVFEMALTDLKMKKKRSAFGYLPIGAVAHAATSGKQYDDLEEAAKKIIMVDSRLEIEALDGETGERVAVAILMVEGKKKDREEKSWEALGAEIDQLAERFGNRWEAYQARSD